MKSIHIDIKELKERNSVSKKIEHETFCSRDIAKMYNISMRSARRRIERLLDKGEAEFVEYKREKAGHSVAIKPIYRFVR